MDKLLSEYSFSGKKTAVCLVLSVLLLISLVPAPVLAQEGTTIPGSGTGTTQSGGAAGTTTQSGESDGCGGTLGCFSSSANNVKNGFISIGEAGYNFANPLNPEGGGEEIGNASSELGQAKDDAKSGVKQIPGPWEVLMDLLGKAIAAFVNFVLTIVDGILWAMFSLPAPGTATDPGTWFDPSAPPINSDNASIMADNNTSDTSNISDMSAVADNSTNGTTNATAGQPMGEGDGVNPAAPPVDIDFSSWWDVVWKIYAALGGIASLVLFVTGVFTLSSSGTPRERNERLRDLGIATALVLFGPVIMPGILHFGNIVTAALVPDATEFVSSPENLLKIGEAVGFALIGSYISSGLMAAGVLISAVVSFVQWIMTFMIAATWVIWAALYGSQNATLKAWSRVGFASFGILVALKIFQALLFRFAWMLPLSFNEPADSVLTLIAFPLLLYIIFHRLPKYAVKKTIPAFVTTVGSGSNNYSYVNSTERNLFYYSDDEGTNNPFGGDSGNNNNDPPGSPSPGGGTGAKRTRTRDNGNDTDIDSDTNNPDDSGSVEASSGADSPNSDSSADINSDTNNPDDSGNVDPESDVDDSNGASVVDTSSGANTPDGGSSSSEIRGGGRRRSEEELQEAYAQHKSRSGSGEGAGSTSSTESRSSTNAPTDQELNEALKNADEGGSDAKEPGGRGSISPDHGKVPPEIQQHMNRMDQEGRESDDGRGSRGTGRTRDSRSDDSDVTEVVERMNEQPSSSNSGVDEGASGPDSDGSDSGGGSSGGGGDGGS